jgi:hypothetical protein
MSSVPERTCQVVANDREWDVQVNERIFQVLEDE